ncbi:hypothetical protein [Sutterella sp.]|uniref:hypothetical protein n=1 Tax=Sutterella sp. TaxID=1981025 RepID=UPI0026DF7453|nr:hypothetical protein [Sutterella sp.]MDO5532411.1 hypothetical protein [Sutterella sp.]
MSHLRNAAAAAVTAAAALFLCGPGATVQAAPARGTLSVSNLSEFTARGHDATRADLAALQRKIQCTSSLEDQPVGKTGGVFRRISSDCYRDRLPGKPLFEAIFLKTSPRAGWVPMTVNFRYEPDQKAYRNWQRLLSSGGLRALPSGKDASPGEKRFRDRTVLFRLFEQKGSGEGVVTLMLLERYAQGLRHGGMSDEEIRKAIGL